MRKLFVLLFMVPWIGHAQELTINLKVLQGLASQAKIHLYQREQIVPIDSSGQIEQGTYRFTIPANHEQGLYRISVGKNIAFNVVIADEPSINIQTVVYAPEDSISFTNSKENSIYWQYQNQKRKTNQHAWLLRSLAENYPDSSTFRQMVLGELYRIEIELYSLALKLVKENPDLLASKLIAIEQRPVAPPFIESDLVADYLKKSWWQFADLNDSRLLSSPEFPKYLWGYVETLFNEGFDKEMQDEQFIAGIDYLMATTMSPETRAYIRAQLIDGFTDSDYEAVMEHLNTKTFGDLPALYSAADWWKLQGGSPTLKVGDAAFDFKVKGKDGKMQSLSKIRTRYKLIIFWSSWCPYCLETLPRLADVYEKYKNSGFEVFAVNIDEEDELYNAYVSKMHLNWYNIHEPNSESSKIIHMYNVNETPKMFLLSENLRIVSRPSTRRQLESKLKQLLR